LTLASEALKTFMFKQLRLTATLLFVALAVAVAFSSCGDDSSTADGAEAPTKAVYIKRADRFCDQGNREQSEAMRTWAAEHQGQIKGKAAELALLKRVILPHIKSTVEDFGELEAPEGDQGKINAIVAANLKAVEEGEQNLKHMLKVAGSPPGSKASPFGEGTKLAMAYGFETCGQY
jgi:hypothetical protein